MAAMYGKTISTRLLSEVVSALAKRRVEVRWAPSSEIVGGMGDAKWDSIRLSRGMAYARDGQLAEVFWHEVGHVLLNYRGRDGRMKSDAEREAEASVFAEMMLSRGGFDLFWELVGALDGLQDEEAAVAEARAVCGAMMIESRKREPMQGLQNARGALSPLLATGGHYGR